MSQADSIALEIERNLDSVNETFMGYVDKAQIELLALIEAEISRFEYENGELTNSQENIILIASIIALLEARIATSSYFSGLRFYSDSIKTQFGLIRDYYSSVGENISPAQLSSITEQENTLLRSAVESLTQVEAALYTPIKNALVLAVVGGSSRDALLSSIREVLLGSGNRKGRLAVFANTLSDTLFASITRTITFSIAKLLGFKKYKYVGGLIKDSRDFCIERNGGTFDVETIRSWADIPSWQGKIPNTTRTTIFSYLGGYRCRHWLIPVR